MGLLALALRAAVVVAVIACSPLGGSYAQAGDDLEVSPRYVRPGEVVTVRLTCQDLNSAFASSKAFGRVDFKGDDSIDVTVNEEPGRYRVRGACGDGGQWKAGGDWLVVEGDREGRSHGWFGGGRGFDKDCGAGYEDGFCDDDDDYEPWPEGGVATGDGVTAMRQVDPMTSAGVGIGAVGAIVGVVIMVRRRRRRAGLPQVRTR